MGIILKFIYVYSKYIRPVYIRLAKLIFYVVVFTILESIKKPLRSFFEEVLRETM